MAIRDDISVDWNASPRIITVLSPSVSITLQDLHDTLVNFEDEPGAMTYEPLIRSEGKADLGGGVLTGITSKLLNAKLAFAARKTFVSVGTITTTDATGKTLIDSGATFVSDGVEPGAWIVNLTTGQIASVLRVTSETALVTDIIASGFTSADDYKLVNVIQCDVNGGNLVAIDSLGATVSAVLPTAGTQVKITAASSATLQELSVIQIASYNESVIVDLASSYAGTTYPIGTYQQPVNNLADALSIATTQGFNTLKLVGNVTLDTYDFTNFNFVGISPHATIITVDPSATVAGCSFSLLRLDGTLDGAAFIGNCSVGTVDGVKGVIKDSILLGNITMDANPFVPLYIIDCSDGIPGTGTPVIDFGGAGAALNLRGYRGGISLSNKSGADDVSVDGHVRVTLDASITAGSFIIRGIGKVTNNATGTTTVDDSQLVSNPSIADAVWDETAASHVTAGTMGELANAGGSLTPTQSTMLLEMYRLLGLDPTKPLVVTPTTRKVPADGSDVNQTITRVGDDVTVQRV